MGINISVIIVNYNNFILLENCLLSLFNNNCEISFEVIVVDNASTMGDIESIAEKFPAVIFIKNKINEGFAAANNKGAMVAKGKYLLFLNNDTLFLENTLKKVFDFAETQNEEVLVGCKLLNVDMSHQESIVNFTSAWNSITENFFLYKLFPKSPVFNKYYQNYQNYDKPMEVDVVKGAFLFCSNLAFKRLNSFDDRFYFYGEETDFCYRFKKNIGKVYYYPETRIIHIGGAGTDNHLWFKYKNQAIGHLQVYQKHFNGLSFFIGLVSHYIGIILRAILYLIISILTFNKKMNIKSYYFAKQLFVYPKNKFKMDKVI